MRVYENSTVMGIVSAGSMVVVSQSGEVCDELMGYSMTGAKNAQRAIHYKCQFSTLKSTHTIGK